MDIPPDNDVEVKVDFNNTIPNLTDYTPVPRQKWQNIPQKCYIRYEKKNGEIPRGGFVNSIWKKPLENGEIIKIELTNGFTANSIKWSITSNNVLRIWKKKTQPIEEIIQTESQFVSRKELLEMKQQLTEQFELSYKADIDLCKNAIENLNREIKNMQVEQARIVNVIKKISQRISL